MDIKANIDLNKAYTKKYSGSKFYGKNIIPDSSKICTSILENCKLGENVKITNCNLKNCSIQSNSIIGFANNIEPLNNQEKNKYFGTDGIRGIWEKDNILNIGTIKKLAKALNLISSQKIVLGIDTRETSPIIAKLLIDELKKYGAVIYYLNIVPTACVSFYTIKLRADYGIMITASHNPAIYNGIKLFDKNGVKLFEEEENKLEKKFNKKFVDNNRKHGKKINITNNEYLSYLINIDDNKLENIKIVLDCANGVASEIAEKLFTNLRATVISYNKHGEINNNCGALFPELLQKLVLINKADLGFAFDGDADRIITVNNKGAILDGDEMLYLLSWYYQKQNKLDSKTIIGTILTNVGIENKLKALGLNLLRTKVGDKYIIQQLQKNNYELGGEQSGHLIIKKFMLTGDGLLVARILTSLYLENRHIFNSVKENKYIQINKKIKLTNKLPKNFFDSPEFKKLYIFYINKLPSNGRIIIRPSGTEPIIRIMVETTDKNISLMFALDIKKRLSKLINNLNF